MPYIASIQNQSYRVDTGEHTPEREITIDGVPTKIDWRAIAPLAADAKGQISTGGRFSLLISGQSYEVFARRIIKLDENGSQTYEIQFAGQRFEVQIEDEREKTLAGSARSAHDTGEAKVRAPMPGLVIGIPLEVGSQVERGQTVVVLEAMKMENDLAAPKAGTLKEVKVSKGQTVNQGDILVIISGE
jgi:biotin carboxyl carrier protein